MIIRRACRYTSLSSPSPTMVFFCPPAFILRFYVYIFFFQHQLPKHLNIVESRLPPPYLPLIFPRPGLFSQRTPLPCFVPPLVTHRSPRVYFFSAPSLLVDRDLYSHISARLFLIDLLGHKSDCVIVFV